MRPWLSILAALTLASACAHPANETKASTDRSVLTREELSRTEYSNLYDAVSALRRNWLQTRGPDSARNPSQLRVYLDNVMLGGAESLRNLLTTSVAYLQFYDGIAATTRWGTDHGAGVIYISSRAAPTKPR